MAIKKQTVQKEVSKKADDSKTFAFIATFLSIIGFVIALVAKKDDKYVMYYAKQSLVIFIVYIIAGIIGMIPFLGWFFLGPILYLVSTILWVISWIYALSGEEKKIFFVSKFADKFNF